MQDSLHVEVTAEDIARTPEIGCNDPILLAIARTTGSLWRVPQPGVMLELVPPCRGLFLPTEALSRLKTYEATKQMAPFEFDARMKVPKQPVVGLLT